MLDFERQISEFFEVMDISACLQHAISTNTPYILLDLTLLFNYNSSLYAQLTKNFYSNHPKVKKVLEKYQQKEISAIVLDVVYYNDIIIYSLKDLTTTKLNTLLTFRATITRTSSVKPELSVGCFQCLECLSFIYFAQKNKYQLPLLCSNSVCKNRTKFKLVVDRSYFNDWQKLFCQESFDSNLGNMPKTLVLFARNFCCEICKPGEEILVTGVLSVVEEVESKYGLVFMVNYAQKENLKTESGITRSGITESGITKNLQTESGQSPINLKETLHSDSIVEKDSSNEISSISQNQILQSRSFDEKTESEDIAASQHKTPTTSDIPSSQLYTQLDFNFLNNSQPNNSGSCNPLNATTPHLSIVPDGYNLSLLNISNFVSFMRNTPDLYSKLSESLFPYIHGHTYIKQSILLLLAQGTPKKSKTTNLRGDINILLIGDPGTAKSQFLKQTSKILPRSVYTSGKSASAAGLTACVIRDTEGEFTIEAGALMLSDQSVCCIDEFNNMDVEERVSIHEAMEQGTITINKAGINATLNARCSVLAAANPISGKYDERKTLRQNISLSDAIMSRFDLFFVVVDLVDEVNDRKIAEKILSKSCGGEYLNPTHIVEGNLGNTMYTDSIHSDPLPQNTPDLVNSIPQNNINSISQNNINSVSQNNINSISQNSSPFFTIEEMREYILFIRKNIKPKLTPESKQTIVKKYTKLRQDSIINSNNYRVTVRQLESLIRLSEALAKIHLDEIVKPIYVEEAYKLLKGSVIEIKNEDVKIYNEDIRSQILLEKSEYSRIVNAIIFLIKSREKLDKLSLENEYLLLREDKIESVEQFNKEQEVVKGVLEHLIYKEGVLYEIDDRIYIHPSYDA